MRGKWRNSVLFYCKRFVFHGEESLEFEYIPLCWISESINQEYFGFGFLLRRTLFQNKVHPREMLSKTFTLGASATWSSLYSFIYHSWKKRNSFRITSTSCWQMVPLLHAFNCSECTVFKIWITHKTKTLKQNMKCVFSPFGLFYRPKWPISLPFQIISTSQFLPFYIPEAWKRYPFWVKPPHIGYYREYPLPPPLQPGVHRTHPNLIVVDQCRSCLECFLLKLGDHIWLPLPYLTEESINFCRQLFLRQPLLSLAEESIKDCAIIIRGGLKN